MNIFQYTSSCISQVISVGLLKVELLDKRLSTLLHITVLQEVEFTLLEQDVKTLWGFVFFLNCADLMAENRTLFKFAFL